ncbi:MAG: tetratricopeptide repeat protein [Anaeromyxobacteraceae bacterium]
MTAPETQPSAPLRPGLSGLHAAAATLLVAATVAGYAPAAGGEFHWDDDLAVLENPAVLEPARLGWRDFVPPSLGRDRPLTDVTFAVNYALTGNANAPFVYTNVAIHLLAALLVFAVARALLRRLEHPRASALAFVVAAFFALHPLQTEAVSFVCQRAESLASMLYLLAVLAWLKAEELNPDRRWLGWFAGGTAAALAALAAKGMAITLPVVALVAVLLTGRRRAHGAGYWAVAWGAPIGIALLLAASTVLGLRGVTHAGLDAGPLGPWRYLLTEATVIVRYIGLLLWPAGLSIDHGVRASPGLGDATTLLSGVVVVGLVAGALACARAGSRPGGRRELGAVALGIFWYLLVLAPTTSFVPLADPMAEHRVYLANFGLMLAAVVAADLGLVRLAGERSGAKAGVALAFAVSAALLAVLATRNGAWRTELALWGDAAAAAPLHWRPQLHTGNALKRQNRHQEALAYYERAASLVPANTEYWAPTQRSLADGLSAVGRHQEARAILDAAIAREPKDLGLREARAWSRYSVGDLEGAVAEVATCRFLGADTADLSAVAGKSAASRGDIATALRELRHAVDLSPFSSLRRSDLAIAAQMAGLGAEACEQIGRFVALEKDEAMRQEGIKLQAEWRCAGR